MPRVYFATNRNPIGDPPTGFGKKLGPIDGTALRVGWAEVDLKQEKMTGLHVEPERLVSNRIDPEVRHLRFGSDAVFKRLRDRMARSDRDTLLYIHGFANPFDETVLRAAQIQAFYNTVLNTKLNVFLFSWPSDGEVLFYDPYFRDRADAESSGEALARGIMMLARYMRNLDAADYCERCVHIMAHSMGNYAFVHGIKALKQRLEGRQAKIFDKVFLMAADADHDVLTNDEKLAFLPKIAREVCVYHTDRDRALTISDRTKGNPERLGAEGPPNAFALPDKVSVIDVSDVLYADDDLTNHQYYRINGLVRDDVAAVFNGMLPARMPWRTSDHRGRFRILAEDDRPA